MTIKPKGEKAESIILQKIGDDLYRGEEDGGLDVLDLELNTFLGYIRSCKIVVYDKEHSDDSSMVWDGTMILKRK